MVMAEDGSLLKRFDLRDPQGRPQENNAPQTFTGKIEEVIVVTDEGRERDCTYAEELQVKHGLPVVVVGAGQFLVRRYDQSFSDELAKSFVVFDKPQLMTDEPSRTNGFSSSSMKVEKLREDVGKRVSGVPDITRQSGSEDIWTMMQATANSRNYQLAHAA